MTTSNIPEYSTSSAYSSFEQHITLVASKLDNADDFHLELYYSNIITTMEKYLYDLYVNEVSNDQQAFNKMCKLPKFANLKYPLQQALHQDIRVNVINTVKNMVWHRLNDLAPMFKETLGIRMNISRQLTNDIDIRHHIVHRNGFDLNGNKVAVTKERIEALILSIKQFVTDIDRKFHRYLHSV